MTQNRCYQRTFGAAAATGNGSDRWTYVADRPWRVELLVGELAAGEIDVSTFMDRLDALVTASRSSATEEQLDRARRRWRAVL